MTKEFLFFLALVIAASNGLNVPYEVWGLFTAWVILKFTFICVNGIMKVIKEYKD